MKPRKHLKVNGGFTLVEILISLALTGMLVSIIGSMLVFGYRQLGRIIDINKGSTDIMVFRNHIESRIHKMTGKGFRLDAAHIVNTADVGFVEWREYSVALPTLPNGLPNFAAAVPVGVSDWTNLVGKKVIFNSIEPQGGRLVRCIYEYMPRTNEVSYREYDVPLNAAGQEDDLTDAEPTTAKRIDAIILKDITVFQIGRSSQGLRDWEAYPTIGESQLMTNPITNAYIRVFVRTRNEDLRYRTNKSFLSRSNRREYNFWTPNNKNTSYEFDPTLVAYL